MPSTQFGQPPAGNDFSYSAIREAIALRIPRGMDQGEIERQLRAGQVFAVICGEAVEWKIDLPDQDTVRVAVQHCAHLFDDFQVFRPVTVVKR